MGGRDITGYQPRLPDGKDLGLTGKDERQILAYFAPLLLHLLCYHSPQDAPRGSRGKWYKDQHWRVNFKKNKGLTCISEIETPSVVETPRGFYLFFWGVYIADGRFSGGSILDNFILMVLGVTDVEWGYLFRISSF